MRPWLRRFLTEQDGFVNGPEWAFVTTILVLGAITASMWARLPAEREPDQPAAVQMR